MHKTFGKTFKSKTFNFLCHRRWSSLCYLCSLKKKFFVYIAGLTTYTGIDRKDNRLMWRCIVVIIAVYGTCYVTVLAVSLWLFRTKALEQSSNPGQVAARLQETDTWLCEHKKLFVAASISHPYMVIRPPCGFAQGMC